LDKRINYALHSIERKFTGDYRVVIVRGWINVDPMSKALLSILLCCSFLRVSAQSGLTLSPSLRITGDSAEQRMVLDSLKSLFHQIHTGRLTSDLVNGRDSSLTNSVLLSFREMGDSDVAVVVNDYPVDAGRQMISIAFLSGTGLEAMLTILAERASGRVTFSIPLSWITRYWKKKVIGRITYYYPGVLDTAAAKAFDENNSRIAKRLGLVPEKFRFYLTDNYQEINQLLGYTFDRESNGVVRNGYGPGTNTIFAIQGSEDFSHDLVHYYTFKIRGNNKRNAAVEEGLAYEWGNAYYTDVRGRMITEKAMVTELQLYLYHHPDTSLWELFMDNPKILSRLAPEISVRSAIAALLCGEVERQAGLTGIKALINCGPGNDNFFNALNTLIGVNRENFDRRVQKLMQHW
jgi:hypothetical protein